IWRKLPFLVDTGQFMCICIRRGQFARLGFHPSLSKAAPLPTCSSSSPQLFKCWVLESFARWCGGASALLHRARSPNVRPTEPGWPRRGKIGWCPRGPLPPQGRGHVLYDGSLSLEGIIMPVPRSLVWAAPLALSAVFLAPLYRAASAPDPTPPEPA